MNLTLEGPNGTASYFFGTDAPGLIAAQAVVKGDDGTERVVSEPRIQAFWLQTAAGYHLEARIPLSFVGRHLWVEAIDGRGKGRAGFGAADSKGGRLFFATAGLDALLQSFIGDGTRATVIDANALKLGTAGNIFSKKRYEARGLRTHLVSLFHGRRYFRHADARLRAGPLERRQRRVRR